MKINNTNKNKRFLIRFVTSYSILLIIVLIMGMFFYRYGMREVKDNLHEQNISLLDNAVNELDTSLSLMSTLVTQVSNDINIRKLLRYTSADSTEFSLKAKDAMNFLTNFIPLESILPIDEFYIYLPKTDYLLSSRMLKEARLYYQHDKSFDMSLYPSWLSDLSSIENTKVFIPQSPYSKNGNTSFLYKLPLSDALHLATLRGTICFEVNRTDLNKVFSNLDYMGSGFLYVKDQDNKEVFRITTDKSLDFSPELVVDGLKSSSTVAYRYTELILNDKTMVVTAIPSNVSHWTFYLVQPSEFVFKDLVSYQVTYLVIIILTCLFCLLMIFILSKQNIKPILKIDRELQNSLNEKHYLKKELEEQRPIIYNSYMAKIMKGLISTKEESDHVVEYLGLYKEGYKYMILYASIYQDISNICVEEMTGNPALETENKNYKELLYQYFYKYLGEDILIYQAEANAFAIMMPSPTSETFEDSIQRISSSFGALHDILNEEQFIWIYGGLGNRNFYANYLWKSYQQAMQAASYVEGGTVFLSFHDIKRDQSTYYYPFEMAQQLSNFICCNNISQVQEIFHLIRRENFENRALPVTLIKWLLSDIRNTLLKVRFTLKSNDSNEESLNKIDMVLGENKTLDLLEEIALSLCELFEQKEHGNKIIHEIKLYIKENYKDPALCLKKISEQFNISESYFSYLFKAETKQNFSEHLEILRMTQAMLLIKTTDINVSELYLETGYNNANSFRRAFKKIHGVAPKIIRESLKTT